mgnify:CR=1 FL=1
MVVYVKPQNIEVKILSTSYDNMRNLLNLKKMISLLDVNFFKAKKINYKILEILNNKQVLLIDYILQTKVRYNYLKLSNE